MENPANYLLKMVLKNGHVVAAYADEGVVTELVSHPKFLCMRDTGNDIYMSIDDVIAFEILNNRKEPVKLEDQQPVEVLIEQKA
jgi:hypothetical protein